MFWLLMPGVIQTSALDHQHLTEAMRELTSCSDTRRLPPYLDTLSYDDRAALVARASQGLCTAQSQASSPAITTTITRLMTAAENGLRGLLEHLKGCCGSCYICRP